MRSVRLSGQKTKHVDVIVFAFIALVYWYSTFGRETILSFIGNMTFSHATPTPVAKTVQVVSQESLTVATVKKTAPSVVTIVGSVSPQVKERALSVSGSLQTTEMQQEPDTPDIVGSGFVVSDGLIVTGKHVMTYPDAKYLVVTADDRQYMVEKIYKDPKTDIAILKISPDSKLTPLTLGDSSKIAVGENVIAIGTALGQYTNTVTTGIVSGLGRGITAGDEAQTQTENLDNLIQTSAPINPGSSGGPLMNDQGEVIGMNIAVAESAQNINFALPINKVKATLAGYKLGL